MAADEQGVELSPVDRVPASNRLPLQPAQPRLRLHHLFTLTAVMSVMLAVSGPREIKGFEAPRILQLAFVALGVVYTILASVAITIVAYGLAWRRRGYAFFSQPGHWLLVTIVAYQLVFIVPLLIERAVAAMIGRPYGDESLMPTIVTTWLLPGSTMLALNIFINRKKCSEKLWSRVFYSKALAAILPAIGELLVLLFLERAAIGENPRRPHVQPAYQQRGYVQLITADYRQRQSRDAFHWIGVAIQFAFAGMSVVIVGAVFIWAYLSIFSA